MRMENINNTRKYGQMFKFLRYFIFCFCFISIYDGALGDLGLYGAVR